MKQCHLTIAAKTQTSVNDFFLFLFNNSTLNFYIIKKYFKKKKRKKILTILKSPHVNKTAQEQFEYKFFSKQLSIYSTKNFKYLIFLKKLNINLFPEVTMKIKFSINKKYIKKLQVKIFDPDNFNIHHYKNLTKTKQKTKLHKTKKLKIKNYNNNQKLSNQKIKYLLKIFDIYGELITSNLFR